MGYVFAYRKHLLLGTALLTSCAMAGAAAQETSRTEPQEDVIVVQALRGGQSIDKIGDSVSILDAEQIELQQLTTLDEALERIPGVAITRSGGVGQNTQVRMRGFTSKHVLVMIDGVKVNNPAEADNQFGIDHLFLDDVEQIEVLRGPQSGVYGADAVAGVINIVTKRPQGPTEWRGSAMVGENDTYELRAGGMGGNETFGLSGGVSYYETEGISLSSRAPGNTERDGYENLTAQIRGEYRPTENVELSAWLRRIDAKNEIDAGSLPADNPEGLPGYLFQDSEGYTDNTQTFGALKGVWDTLDGKLTHTAQVSYVDIESTYVAPGTEQDSEGTTTEALYYATFRPVEKLTLVAGAEYRNEEGVFEQPEGYAFALVDDSISNTAGFLEANLEILEGLYLSGAVRYDDNEKFGGETTFRTTAAYNLPEGFDIRGVDTKIRASYGEGAEAPGLRQLLGSSATFQGNPDLQPESSWMYDVGLDQMLENGLASWSLTYYEGEADDGIFNVTDPVTFISSPQNVESPVEMEGVELDLKVMPADWIDVQAAYTHMSVELVSTGVQLFGRPKNEGSVAVTVRPRSDLAVTLDGYWRDEFFSDYPSSYEMDGYSLLNLTAVWDVTDNVKIAANVHNLTDEFYEEKLGDSTYGRTAQVRLSVRY